MMCYKDKTFCPFDNCAKFGECDRALTDTVIADAVKWWGNDEVPVCTYVNEPDCFELSSILDENWTNNILI